MTPFALPLADTLVWGQSSWRGVAAALAAGLLLVLVWGYWNSGASAAVRWTAGGLKALGIVLLVLCLLEPLLSGTRARPGANVFVVLADNSRSMTLRDRGQTQTRAEQLKAATTRPAPWLERIGETFDLRVHAFDATLHAAGRLGTLDFEGDRSNLAAALAGVQRQYAGRPLAGVALLSDGSATDADALNRLLDGPDAAKLPPVYPVPLGGDLPADDINLRRVDVSQTDFEDAPVTVTARLTADGYRGRRITARLVDDAGKTVEQQTLTAGVDGTPLTARFKLRPEKPGVSFYRVHVAEEGRPAGDAKAGDTSGEATLANNTRQVVVDRGRGPYRVLYVAGRPNWEFKFLQRALAGDDQVQLVGLVRIAKREPKFAYIGKAGDASNPLFRGFENKDAEQAEQYDRPVLTRLNTRDADELRGGFPRTADELDAYSAVILDDLEAEFFTQDQLGLLKEFVRQRGGGLLMLGGMESFREGRYDRTAVGDLLPVYAGDTPASPAGTHYRLSLTREGWLAPWVRLRPDEAAERTRLGGMPAFLTLNGVRGIKPGATVLATADVVDDSGNAAGAVPALVEQRFGKGRAAALLIGDLWRWSLHRPEGAADDAAKAWRQAVRWLVSDVPRRVELNVAAPADGDEPSEARRLQVRVRDAAFAPQDNAAVALHVNTPDGKGVDLPAEADASEAGLYTATYVPRRPGAYRVRAVATGPDGRESPAVETGWTTDPAPDEFNDLRPDRALLERVAARTGGQVVAVNGLDAFARTLPSRRAEVVDPDIYPLWQTPWVFALAVACLAGEWGLRRWKGLP